MRTDNRQAWAADGDSSRIRADPNTTAHWSRANPLPPNDAVTGQEVENKNILPRLILHPEADPLDKTTADLFLSNYNKSK